MSKKQPINISIRGDIEVYPDGVYESEVVPCGNGAMIKFFKRFEGKKVIVLVVDKMKNKTEEQKEREDFAEFMKQPVRKLSAKEQKEAVQQYIDAEL